MPMAHMQSLILLLIASMLVAGTPEPPSGYRFELTRCAINRTRLGVGMLSATPGTISTASYTANPNIKYATNFIDAVYVMELAIGDNPVLVIADTGSDLIWTKEDECSRCKVSALSCSSTTPSGPTCNICSCDSNVWQYSSTYARGRTFTMGYMVTGRLGFLRSANDNEGLYRRITLGCATSENMGLRYQKAFIGIAGLGRGPLSLVQQLGCGVFAYCLTTYKSPLHSPILFGGPTPDLTTMNTTPLVQNPEHRTRYYVNLKGISIGDTRLPIPEDHFMIRENGNGGMFVDSGTSYTHLEDEPFGVVVDHVRNNFCKDASVDKKGFICYPVESCKKPLHPPEMVLHFDGNVDMHLPWDNYMIEEKGQVYLAIKKSSGEANILGNYQQQNILMHYDLEGEKISFKHANCAELKL